MSSRKLKSFRKLYLEKLEDKLPLAGGLNTVEFLPTNLWVNEDSTDHLELFVSRTGSVSESITVDFEVSGTAQFGLDYTEIGTDDFTETHGSVTFPVGTDIVNFRLSGLLDSIVELDETVVLTLSESENYEIGSADSVTATFENDDNAVISFQTPSAPEGVQLTFTANISNPVDVPIWFYVSTEDGTANSLSGDYFPIDREYVQAFDANSTTPYSISIDTEFDSSWESNETLYLVVSGIDTEGRHVTLGGDTQWLKQGLDIDGENERDNFGWDSSISGNGKTVAIGALNHDGPNGEVSGHVKVYDLIGTDWIQRGSSIPGKALGDRFGSFVQISKDGNTFVSGTKYNDDNGESSGHAQVYHWDGTNWKQLGDDIYGEAANDWCEVVSISENGQTVAVGAKNHDANGDVDGDNFGQVRVFDWDGINWVQRGNEILGESENDNAGASLSLSDNGQRIVVASSGHWNGNPEGRNGKIRVFQWDGINWEQVGQDLIGADNDYLGYSAKLSADGNTVISGAISFDSGRGRVKVYDWNGSEWEQRGNHLSGQWEGDSFGHSLGMSDDGNTVAISSLGYSNASGLVQIFCWNGSNWIQQGQSLYSEGSRDWFGVSLGMSSDGGTVVIGAPLNDNNNGTWSGHARIYQLAAATGIILNHNPPTVDWVNDLSIIEDASEQTVDLTGITDGDGDDPTQPLVVSAISNNSSLITEVTVDYTSPNETATLKFSPEPDESGTATITVTVEDGGLDNDLSTPEDNATFSQSFEVTVNPVNDVPSFVMPLELDFNESVTDHEVSLTSISPGPNESDQPIVISVSTDNSDFLSDLSIDYTSGPNGTLMFSTVDGELGRGNIFIAIEDGGLDRE
ncbi:MAG: Calx-beta domain-containing protein, partial [Planctomycetota bacterium]|nr:Calx-beta domain-containing protein [Planctomycetota bacterium]